MGIGKDLRGKVKEFKKNPKEQYFKHLEKLLNISKTVNIPKKEVFEYVEEWHDDQ